MPASAAVKATFRSSAPAPVSTWPRPGTMSTKPRPSRITIPGMPPSRTRRFEPTPIIVTGISGVSAARNAARSSVSAGRNNPSAGPPTRNHVIGPIGSLAVSPSRTADPRDRRLAGRVDIGDEHDIGIVETGAEAVEQIVQPGVAVRLHDGDDAVCDNCAGGFQNGGDLDRVVAVIVDDRGAVPLAGLCEAALDAAELAQRRAHDLIANAELRADGDGRQRVLHIVDAEPRQ